MGRMKALFLILALASQAWAAGQPPWLDNLGLEGGVQYWTTPDPNGHAPFIQAIEGAKSAIFMEMFHLTDPAAVQALLQARHRGVTVQVILDGTELKGASSKKIFDELAQGGVEVRASSPAFSITHVKAMLVDDTTSIVSSINLTLQVDKTRDHGVLLQDPGVFKEMKSVFEGDWINAAQKTGETPALANPNLIWSPVDSENRLVDLIGSARQTIDLTVENLGDSAIQAALLERAKAGVSLRVIVPLCDENPNPLYNLPFVSVLKNGGVQARVMPGPASLDHPYMHAKMIAVDGKLAYLGSINFSKNSTTAARELGIVLDRADVVSKLEATFEQDWSRTIEVPAQTAGLCTAPAR